MSSSANEGLKVFILLNAYVGLHGMFPMAQDLMPKTCNNQSKAKRTKGGFCTSTFIFLQVIDWK
jgi:hypothetical protein